MVKEIYRILIVEDSEFDRQIYKRYLNKDLYYKYQIFEAETGKEALDIFLTHNPDLILIDFLLPDMNGLELIETIQKIENDPPIPIIMLTGQGNETIAIQAMKHNIYDYLVKGNIDNTILINSIHRIINLKNNELKDFANKIITVLILDNSPQDQQIYRQFLQQEKELNFNIIQVETGEEALKICQTIPPNIILLDLKFPDSNGIELINKFKSILDQSIINTKINDPCFQGEIKNKYLNLSYKQVIDDISQTNIDQCYRNLLAKYQVKSAIAIPLLLEKNDQFLWGLLIAHYCSEIHFWEKSEIFFLQELCVQISVAIKQGLLVKDLKEARQKAEEANILKTAFLANMSHEIRTPMNGILGMTELLNYTNLDNEQKEFVNTIQSSGRSLLNLINDILDLSKLEAKQVELDCQKFNLSQLVKEIYNLLSTQAHKKNLKLTYNLSQNIPDQFLGDSFRLRQIIINLINNAIKFTSQGEVNLTIEEIKKDLSQYNNFNNPICLKFSIKDTGIGIKKEDQETLFKPFSQVNISTTHNYGGTGLGLSICKQLVELMNGEIGLESNEGQGSTFWFNIIIDSLSVTVKNSENNLKSNSNFLEKSLKDNKVLVVEDNRTNQMVIKLQMKKLGYTIDIANNGQEALEKLKINSYQLVFMDCQMPILDGYDTTRCIRETEEIKDNIIIGLTAFAMKGDEEKCLEAGMDDYVTKPISLENLQALLNKWLKI